MADCEERRRSDDVYRALDRDVFPRLGKVEDNLKALDGSVNKLIQDGCAQRQGDLRRTAEVEASATLIFEKIDGFGDVLADARIDMVKQISGIREDLTKQVGGIRAWVLGGCVVALASLLGLLGQAILK